MKRLGHFFTVIVITAAFASCTETDSKAPSVVETFPVNGTNDVDPSTSEISVMFDEPMTDGNWSWAYTSKNQFPETTGQPHYEVYAHIDR